MRPLYIVVFDYFRGYNPTIVEPGHLTTDGNCKATTGDETTLVSTNSTSSVQNLEVPSTPSFNPQANLTILNTKRARTPAPILKLKFRKLGSSWKLRGDDTGLRRSKRSRK